MQDLSFVDFSYACLKNVFFSRANLQCAKFRVGIVYHKCEALISSLRMTFFLDPCFALAICQTLHFNVQIQQYCEFIET